MSDAVLFISVAKQKLLYTNPILLQLLAGAVKQAFTDLAVEFLDAAAGDDCLARLVGSTTWSAIVVAPTDAGDLEEFARVAQQLPSSTVLIFVGNLVTDGDQNALTVNLRLAFPNNLSYAFIGREIPRFIALIRHALFGQHGDLPDIIEVGTRPPGPSTELPASTLSPVPYVSGSVLRAIEERGIFVLAEGLSRGCEHHCTYCRLTFRRQTSGVLQHIAGDSAGRIGRLSAQIPNDVCIFFTDENFFGGHAAESRLGRIITFAQEMASSEVCRVIAVDTRIDSVANRSESADTANLRRNAWEAMVKAGLAYAYVGVESFSQSQLRRYGKNAEYASIRPGIERLRELGIAFTVGMIVMDSLVTPFEIDECLSYIDRWSLYGNVASLLKPIRLDASSPYAAIVSRTVAGLEAGAYMSSTRTFHDPLVRAAWPTLSAVHSLFTKAGYRHSDVALIDSRIRDYHRPDRRTVPEIVGRMEAAILRSTLETENVGSISEIAECLVKEAVREVESVLGSYPSFRPWSIQHKVVKYYQAVFESISSELIQTPPRWIEGVTQ
jgi:hypothetical protein